MKNKISIIRILCQSLYFVLFLYSVISKNVILISALVLAVLLGPVFCGWLCFFGFYQDVCRYIGMIFKKTPIEIDLKIHNYLKFLRYIILFASIYIGSVFLFPDKIKGNFAGLLHNHIVLNSALYAAILLGILSLFTKRFYCRYLCTFGAKSGLYSLIRLFTIKRDKENCVSCGKCSNECLMHIDVKNTESLASPNCIDCFKCIENCPKHCLRLGIRNYLKF